MASMKPVKMLCPSCKQTFMRMVGDVIGPMDLNPYCLICTPKELGKKLISRIKKKQGNRDHNSYL